MARIIVSVTMAVSCAFGAGVAGFSRMHDDAIVREALSDPHFYYLVDSEGNPVSKELD